MDIQILGCIVGQVGMLLEIIMTFPLSRFVFQLPCRLGVLYTVSCHFYLKPVSGVTPALALEDFEDDDDDRGREIT